MQALLLALEPEFGDGKVFRPYRDVRFAKDKTPYKTHQGGYVAVAPATGWYVQVDARGVMVGAGFYDASAERLGRFRDAIVDNRTRPQARAHRRGPGGRRLGGRWRHASRPLRAGTTPTIRGSSCCGTRR